jgi:hypothetical protein
MIRPYLSRAQLNSDRVTALLVTLAPLVYFFPAVRGRLVISPDDGVIFNIPLRVAAANLVRSGYLPLWNPYIFSGMPLHGAAQAGVLFPLNWFYLLFSAPAATNLMMLSTYMLAALGAYLYARRNAGSPAGQPRWGASGAGIMGAALTSLVWQWSGFLVGQIGHTNILQTAALLPWLLWAIDRYGVERGRSRGVLLAVIVALAVFAGHQQTFAYALLVAAAYALVMSRRAKESRTSYLRSLVFIAAGLGLAAVQILPTLELLRNSMRAEASYDFFTSFSMPPRFLGTFLAPYLMGGGDGQLFRAPYVGPSFYAEYNGYVGVITIVLAALAFVLKRDARTKFWTVVIFAGTLLALGRFAPFGFYKLIYHVPILNLFRVPARHLMEVEFALAVLAGRGLTAISETQDRAKVLRWVLISAAAVFVLTCVAITVGRPANFQLGRIGPVSIMRAPELFMPVFVAAASASAIWMFARRRRGATVLLFVVLAFDLLLWGQSSGWRTGSPKSDFELWHEPETVQLLRAREAQTKSAGPYRILTEDQPFDPDTPVSNAAPGGAWVPALQPDIYMMYGVENAAGYDGFGLARYSRLAGDMKVWGALTDPERTLRGASRELDLLNVRYLLVRSAAAAAEPTAEGAQLPTTQLYAGQPFGDENLNVSPISAGERLSFSLPPVAADHIALLTNLAWSETVKDGEIVAQVRLRAQDGETFNFELRAGEHTSEWAYDRPDIRSRIKHKRAPIGTSYEVEDAQAKYEAHTYVSSFALPRRAVIDGGAITVARVAGAPELTLSLSRLTLVDGERAIPLRSESLRKESVVKGEQPPSLGAGEQSPTGPRWQRVAEIGKVAIFENTRTLPRVWLTNGELVATDEEQLNIIRSGNTPGGATWKPLEQVLVTSKTGISFGNAGGPPGNAEMTRHEPNRIEVKTESPAPAILVLSENHYPGWRASVDGQSVEVIRVNYNQRGIALPAGKHLVTFIYRPKSVLIGLVVSLLTLAALLWWSVSSRTPTVREGSDRNPC